MKHALVGLSIVVCVIVIAGVGGLSGRFIPQKDAAAPSAPVKVRRAALHRDASYQSLIDDGARELLKGNPDGALEFYQIAAEKFPREIHPYEKIGDIFYLQKKYSVARDNFELAQSLDNANLSITIKKVRSLLGMRRIFDAKIALEAITPPTQLSLYYRGLIAAFLNDQKLAKDLLKKSTAIGDDEELKNKAQRVLTAYLDFELSRDASIEYLQGVLAYTFDQVGEYGLAIELAFDALKTKPDFRDVWIVLGHAFLNSERWLDAEGALSKALELDSGSGTAYFFRGNAQKYLRRRSEARADFDAALKYGFEPRILAKLEIADILFASSDYASAFPLYSEVVMTDPTDVKRFVRPISLAIRHLNKLEEADALARKAYETHPDTGLALNLLGWTNMARGEMKRAREYLEKAIIREPELPEAHLNLAQLDEQEGRLEEALEHYEKAVRFAKSHGRDFLYQTAQNLHRAASNKEPAQVESKPVPSLSLF